MYRSKVRAVLVILPLGLGVAAFLTTIQAGAGVGRQARELAAGLADLIGFGLIFAIAVIGGIMRLAVLRQLEGPGD